MNRRSAGFFHLVNTLCLSAVASVSLYCQPAVRVASIELSGVKVFQHERVLRSFETQVGSSFQPALWQKDIDRLTTLYADSGYYSARVDSNSLSTSSDSVRLRIFVFEGKQSIVDSVGFEGNASLSGAQLMEVLGFTTGRPFLQPAVEDGARAILVRYENAGFPLTKVSVENVVVTEALENLRVAFTYKVVEGEQVKVKEFRVEGNTTTRSAVIAREARLGEGEFYNEQMANKVRERVERMQLFRSVSQPELFVGQNHEGGLLVKVEEGNPNRFDGVIGYVPSPRPGVSGFLTGLVDLQLRNLFGTARRVAARWYREDQNTQEISLRYFEPWIASYPVNGEVGFFQRIQDSTYVRRAFDLSLVFQLNERVGFGAVVSRTNIIPSESYGRTALAGSQTTSIGVTIAYDTRSDPVTPLSGLYYHSEYDFGKKETYGSSYFEAGSNTIQKIFMDLDYYAEPFKAQVLAAEFHMEDFRSGSTELGDLFRLGGASTLRGYREGQFQGSRIIWSNVEYRFMVERRSFLYGFLDGGYIVSPEVPVVGLHRSEQTKIGYGLGIRLDTALGLVGVSVGFGEGDTFSTAKLHIRLINAF